MSRKYIRQGDSTTTGGAVTSGNSMLKIDNIPVALIGMIATCPACKKGSGPIVAVGKHIAKINGIEVALTNDYVACGCPPNSNLVLASHNLGCES